MGRVRVRVGARFKVGVRVGFRVGVRVRVRGKACPCAWCAAALRPIMMLTLALAK